MDLEEEALAFSGIDNKKSNRKKNKKQKKNNKHQAPVPYTHCLSCDVSVSDNYCPNCGQKNDDMRRSLFALIADTLGGIFSFESRMWKTFGALIFKPGKIAREYANGARTRYSAPIRTYLVVSIIFFTMISVSKMHFVSLEITLNDKPQTTVSSETLTPKEGLEKETEPPEEKKIPSDTNFEDAFKIDFSEFTDYSISLRFFTRDSDLKKMTSEEIEDFIIANTKDDTVTTNDNKKAMSEILRSFLKNPETFNSTVNTWLPRIMFFMVPFAMLLGWLFIRGPKALLIDHLIHAIYLQSTLFIAVLAAILISQFYSSPKLLLFLVLLLMTYFMFSIKRMFNRGWIKTIWTTLVGGYLYSLILLIAVMGIITYAVSNIATSV